MTPEFSAEGIRFALEPGIVSWLTGVFLILVASAIEKFSKSFKPWSWLFGKIGKLINKDIDASIQELNARLDKLESRNDAQDAQTAESDAISARRHIISAGDELRRGIKHSEEWFNEVLEDITTYENYCNTHKNFKNEKASASIRFIRKMYDHVLEHNDFL